MVLVENQEWNSEQFVQWLHGQLRRREMRPVELARRMGKSPTSVSRWLAGDRRPDSRSCDILADVFGVDPDFVLTLAGHRPGAPPKDAVDPLGDLIYLLRRTVTTDERRRVVESLLQGYIAWDREEAANARDRAATAQPAVR